MADTSVGEVFLNLGIPPEAIAKMIDAIKAAAAAGSASANVTVNVNSAPAKAAIAGVGQAFVQSHAQGAAFGHDITHTLEIIGNAAQRLRFGIAEVSERIREIASEAKAEAQIEEKAYARLTNVLGAAAHEGKEFVEVTAKLRQGLTAAQIADATTKFYNFAKSMGATDEQALETSKRFVNLSGDLAKVNGKPFEEVMEALRGQLLRGGNGAAEYGIRVKMASVDNEALRLSGKSLVEELTEEERMQARTNLILGQAGDISNKAATAVQTLSQRQAILKTQTGELLAQVGKYAIEMAGPFVEGMIKAVRYLREFADAHPYVTKGLVVIASLATTAIAVLTGFAIVTEIISSVSAGIAGLTTVLGLSAAAHGAAAAAGGAHAVAEGGVALASGAAAVATGTEAATLGGLIAAEGGSAAAALALTDAFWSNMVAANGDAAAQQRVADAAWNVTGGMGAATTATTANTLANAAGAGKMGLLQNIVLKGATVFGTITTALGTSAGAALTGAAGLGVFAVSVGAVAAVLYGSYKLGAYIHEKRVEAATKQIVAEDSLTRAMERQIGVGKNAAEVTERRTKAEKELGGELSNNQKLELARQMDEETNIELIKKHSTSLQQAEERIRTYQQALSEGAEDTNAFAQAFNKVVRARALLDLKKTSGRTFTEEERTELEKIVATLSDEQKARLGLITTQELSNRKEENQRQILEQQKKLREELQHLEKAQLELMFQRAEGEAKAKKNLEDRFLAEKNALLNKAQFEKQELHEKLGLKEDSPARRQVDEQVDYKAELAVRNLREAADREIAENRQKLGEDLRKQQRELYDEATHAEQEVQIEILRTHDAHAADLAQLQLGQADVQRKAQIAHYELLAQLHERGATEADLAEAKKAYDTDNHLRAKKFAAERAKFDVAEADKRQKAYESADKAAEDAELSLAEARAKSIDSLDGELQVLKRRGEIELEQAIKRGAEARELAKIKQKNATNELQLIEDVARAAKKKAEEEAKRGTDALNQSLRGDEINKDKREGRVSQAAFKQTGDSLEKDLGNIHTDEDAKKYKEHVKNAFAETYEEQKKNVDKLKDEAAKAEADYDAKGHGKGGHGSTRDREAAQADIKAKNDLAKKAQEELDKGVEGAKADQRRKEAKADLQANKVKEEDRARARQEQRAKEEVGAAPDGGPKPPGAGGDDLSKLQNTIAGAQNVLPTLSNAINQLVTGQSTFFQGLTDFGTTVVEKITAQNAKIKELAAKVADNKAKLDALEKNSPNSADSSAAGLGGD